MTTPNGSAVVASAAPSHDHANPDSPWRSLQGARWSEHMAASKPTCSARRAAASRGPGGICSWEAWKPTVTMAPSEPTLAVPRAARRGNGGGSVAAPRGPARPGRAPVR
ncbi:Uncharacterised protein [Mycobacteroides abscessus]|nr:Uncharacterised protein [Mycobacteroides abscessus]